MADYDQGFLAGQESLDRELDACKDELEAAEAKLATHREATDAASDRARNAEARLAATYSFEEYQDVLERAEAAEAKLAEVEKGLHKIADFTEQSGGWTKFPNPGGVAGAVHSIARRLLSGDEEQRPNPAHPDWFPPDGTRKAE